MNGALLVLADGRFPAGGHAYSAGCESAVHYGDVFDVPSLERYLAGRLATAGMVDAAFAAAACAAAVPRTLWQEQWAPAQLFLPQSRSLDAAAGTVGVSATIPATELKGAGEALDAEYEARVASPRAREISRRLGRQLLRAAHAVWPACPRGDHHQPVALGLACAAAGGMPADAAALAFHHLASAVTCAAVRMLGFDPVAVAAVQARAVATTTYDPAWATARPADLPARTSSLTEILAEDHGRWDARLFVA